MPRATYLRAIVLYLDDVAADSTRGLFGGKAGQL